MANDTTLERPKIPASAVRFYEETGWYISDYILEERTIDACIRAAERVYRGQYDQEQAWSDSPHIKNYKTPYTDRTQLRVDQFPSFHCHAIREVTHSKVIAAIAGQLLSTREIRYYKDILIGTPPEAATDQSAIGWHTDISYWPTCIPEKMITVYVPLQDRDETNGTLCMISGSHRWGKKSFNLTAGFDEVDKLKKKFEKEGYRIELEPLPHRKGQVSFHSSLVIHATYPNLTDEFQHTIVFGLQAGENRFVPSPLKRFNKSLVVNLNDEISPLTPEGIPDVKHPEFYPLLYSADEQ